MADRNRADVLDLRINGTTPFLTHRDSLNDRLGEASALLTVVETALHAADEAVSKGHESIVDGIVSLRSGIYARAFEGIKTLVNLAQFHADNLSEK